ncbi:MAG: Fic family protein [Phycisphaerae bacterium]|nr:Fic family protein [Gemmatimonadaceae bacterium]
MKIPASLPDMDSFSRTLRPDRLVELLRAGPRLGPGADANYSNWEETRAATEATGLDAEEQWFLAKLGRRQSYRALPLADATGRPFQYCVPAAAFELLHRIDRDTLATIPAFEPINNPGTRATYLQKSLVEEAIRSGQMDGGSTPRRTAKDMILGGRVPTDTAQRKVFNNHQALEKVREWKDEFLTPDRVLELHSILTTGTLDAADSVGRLRVADVAAALSERSRVPTHELPHATTLQQRLQVLCDFASAGSSGEFMHPVVRATLVMFALSHDAPFVDGNGRTARALFYWVMAREGYALCEYVSISRVFRKARAQYIRAFQDTLQDENDATYFVLYHLRIFTRAIRELQEYLERKTSEIRDVELRLAHSATPNASLNKRQLDVLANALKEPTALYTIEAHRRAHDTAYATSRSDLLQLAESGLLEHRKTGRSFVFVPPPDLQIKLPRAP